jgi:hypothetical protein
MDQSDQFSQLKANVLDFVRGQSADGRIRAMILDLVNQALRAERVVLSNAEKEKLVQITLKGILAEMLLELDE